MAFTELQLLLTEVNQRRKKRDGKTPDPQNQTEGRRFSFLRLFSGFSSLFFSFSFPFLLLFSGFESEEKYKKSEEKYKKSIRKAKKRRRKEKKSIRKAKKSEEKYKKSKYSTRPHTPAFQPAVNRNPRPPLGVPRKKKSKKKKSYGAPTFLAFSWPFLGLFLSFLFLFFSFSFPFLLFLILKKV